LHPLRRGQQRGIARQARRTLGNLLVGLDAAEEGRSGQEGEAPAVSFAKRLGRAADLVEIGEQTGRIRPWIEITKVTPRQMIRRLHHEAVLDRARMPATGFPTTPRPMRERIVPTRVPDPFLSSGARRSESARRCSGDRTPSSLRMASRATSTAR